MNRAWKGGATAVSAAVVMALGAALVHAAPATSDSDDNYKPANTHITGTATGTPAQCPTIGRPAGTVTCFSVPGQKPTMTVYCTHSTSGGLTPATGLGLFVVNPPVVFNDGYTGTTPKPCTDTLGGTETTVVSGTWKIGGIDAANDEGSAEPNSGDKAEVIVPQAGAVVNTSQGCRITVAPNGPYTAIGPYDDHSKFTVPVTNVPVIVTKLKSSCPLPANVPLLSTFFATYIFSPGVSDGS